MQAAVSYQKDVAAAHSERFTGLLIEAAKTGDTRTIETLIAQGANVNGATKAGTTPLMMAASFGQLAALRLLHDRGAAINAIRSDGFNALAFAVFFGHEEVVRYLISHGADIHAKGRCGATVEMWATTRGFLNIADLLREGREGFSVLPASTKYATFESRSEYQPASEHSLHEDRDFKDGGHHRAVEPKPLQDDNLDFDEGIRRVGETKWRTTPADPTGNPYHPAVAGRSFQDNDADFDEGIRRVGRKEWTTASRPAAGQYHTAVASESVDKRKTSVGQTERAATELTVELYPSSAGESIGEGIRRVGQKAWTTTPTGDLAGQYHLAEARGSFSPFSALSDRLGLSWKHAAVIAMFGIAFSGIGIVVALRQLKREAPATLGISPPTSEQPSTIQNQRLDYAEAHSESPVNASTEQRPSEPTDTSTLDDSSRPGGVKVAESQQPTNASANHTMADPDAGKTVTPFSKVTNRPWRKDRRQQRAVRADVSEEESREPNPPAAITFVSKQPEKSTRRAAAPNISPVQPATLIEGSSTKKKVIQWP